MVTTGAATDADYDAVSTLWNRRAGDDDSWWCPGVPASAASIQAIADRGYAIAVAHDGPALVGFGIWRGTDLHGVTASTPEPFYRLLVQWADEHPGATVTAAAKSRASDELVWLEALQAVTVRTTGYEPLRPGQPVEERRPTMATIVGDLDAVRVACLRVLGRGA
jgi:hypothetical protein